MEDRKRFRRGSSYTDSDRSDSEGERPRKTGALLSWIPRSELLTLICTGRYEEHFDRWSRAGDASPNEVENNPVKSPDDSAPLIVSRDMSGDEAYQRRLAMSAGMRAVSPPAAIIHTPSPQALDDDEDSIPGLQVAATHPLAETGDEAYLRRVALSQAQARPPMIPTFSEVATETSPSLAYNPFAPPSVPPPPPGPPGTSVPNALEDKVKAAAAIAARLGALAATAGAGTSARSVSPAPPATHDESEASKKCVTFHIHRNHN
jgi:splicing factor 45